jgi:uncharacterized membrane protein YbhN (UPF0104 family)
MNFTTERTGAPYFGLPRLSGLEDTWERLSSGDPLWLCAAVLLEVAAYAAYVFTFHRLFAEPGSRIGWRESYDISLAGVVASRVFATAGAGGIALTVWALDRSGMDRRLLVTRLTGFYVLVMGYLAGTLGNVLPLPGGLGGVEGAMIGAFVGFGVDGGLAVAAVLGYRAFQYWLPIVPGVISYLRLLRTVRSWDASGEPSR